MGVVKIILITENKCLLAIATQSVLATIPNKMTVPATLRLSILPKKSNVPIMVGQDT